ncbi:MAG: molecular chaperone HscC [Planctomyces sp.]|nr:molecular chaperone HscC [Planctomyces sp.]
MIVGIDLGTTNSLIGWMSPSGPELIPNVLGELLTPSAVGVDHGGELVVGAGAKSLQVTHPERCAAVFKRSMGTETRLTLAGRVFSPEELSSLVLRSLRQDAERHLNQTIEEAVITVPAYFNDIQRKATVRAGELAGFRVRRIINEPTAAAIAYGLHETTAERIAVVYDLGGGTFDVSVMDQFEGVLEVKASAGEVFLGGEDFTRALAGKILSSKGHSFEQMEARYPRLVARLLYECENAKRRLSTQETASIRLPDAEGVIHEKCENVTVSVSEFAELTAPLIHRSRLPLQRALSDAGIRPSQVHEVILVGGATRMPQVRSMLEVVFGKPPRMSLNPDHVVAIGAAVQAALVSRDGSVSEIVVTDVAPFTLGVEVSHEFQGHYRSGYFLPLISRNTPVPVSRSEILSTIRANQTVIQLKIYQGESRRVEDNVRIGELSVNGIPSGPPGQSISVRFTYDQNGILEVDAMVQETGAKFSTVILQGTASLTSEQIRTALEKMQSLKFHPRDKEENRYILLTADRLYRELPPRFRDILGSLVLEFEDSLESQDPARIEESRSQLQQFMKNVDPGSGPDSESWNWS